MIIWLITLLSEAFQIFIYHRWTEIIKGKLLPIPLFSTYWKCFCLLEHGEGGICDKHTTGGREQLDGLFLTFLSYTTSSRSSPGGCIEFLELRPHDCTLGTSEAGTQGCICFCTFCCEGPPLPIGRKVRNSLKKSFRAGQEKRIVNVYSLLKCSCWLFVNSSYFVLLLQELYHSIF